MVTTKKSKAAGQGASADKIRASYVEYLLAQGKQPASIYQFCLDLGIKEDAFYSFFGSFEAIEKAAWHDVIQHPVNKLKNDKTFATFSTREKILSFYFALFEEMKGNRSFVLHQLKSFRRPEVTPPFLKSFKQVFDDFMGSLIAAGKVSGEIPARPYLDRLYPQLFWMHFGFTLLFWTRDDSAGFEKTDAAIEKSVNLAFDLIGKGAIDSAVDFAKFLYQSQK